MEYRNLGRSGLKVSTLCLGTMTFGEADEKSFMYQVGADEATSHAILSRALERGVNFIDTADVYGQDGLSERVIGRWFAASGRRDDVVLATKFRFRMGDGPNGTGAARLRIMRAAEASLRRLQTDRLDLYQIHMQDLDTPEEEILRALDDLVRQGKVLYTGASNYAAYHLTESLMTSDRLGLNRFVSFQPQYSLVVRDIEREHVPLCTRHGVGIIPWSPLASGFLTGKYQRGQAPPEGGRLTKWKERYARFDNERNWRILDAVTVIAKERGVDEAAVSLAWVLGKPGVTSAIFGARTVEQLDENLKAAELTLSSDEMRKLDEASAYEVGYPYEFIKGVQGRW
ncbi:MAG: aldo/keto reductase [Myxococcales bacterium]|nr:aldo/keto reductase [Myxococcales bacterium]MCB9733830.1 aldo/keto reductase [Deltaproteobacteria bacterium]